MLGGLFDGECPYGDSNSSLLIDPKTGYWTRTKIISFFLQKNLSQPPTDLTFLFAQSAGKPKTARQTCQAVQIGQVGGIGLEPTTFAMSTQRSNQLS
jgi:hypothetical protein